MDRPSHDCIVVFIIHVRVHVCVHQAFCFLCVGAHVLVGVGACVCACELACVHASVRACVRACIHAYL